MSQPVTITATLGSIGLPGARGADILDGPLAWAYATRAIGRGDRLPAMRNDLPPVDFPLPLDTWQDRDTWGWCVSRAHPDIAAHTAVQVRRKPATGPMARYATDAKHHAGLGPYKARDTTLTGTVARTVSWDALATDLDDLGDLLGHVTHLGARHRNGQGHVLAWTITPTNDTEAWRDRPMPDPAGAHTMRPRAPYWHGIGRVPTT